jgi:NitT/TauT family transport system substrate-binding protein
MRLAGGMAVAAAPAGQAPTRVRLGVLGTVTDAGFFIGMDLGYYREQGLEIETTTFDSGARMVAPLGTGQIDAGGGAHSAGMFNAAARGIGLKMVADRGQSTPGHGFQALLLRREAVENGTIQNPGDLRGRRVASAASGTPLEILLDLWMRPYGSRLEDAELVELSFGEQALALNSGAIDAALNVEPFVTRIVDDRYGTLFQRSDQIAPGQQVSEVFYGAQFLRDQPDVGRRFMVAYLKAVRFYNDAFERNDPARRQEAIAILTRNTPVKDAALYERMAMPGLAPDGRINVPSLTRDQDFWLARGVQQSPVNLDELVDQSFADAAVAVLGTYR